MLSMAVRKDVTLQPINTYIKHPLRDDLPHVGLDVVLYVLEVVLRRDGERLQLQQVV